jgi:hypothetical protein
MIKILKNTETGDVFCAQIDENHKRYLQYIIHDIMQSYSHVIRVFKKVYAVSENPDLTDIVNDEVDFYAHCILEVGIELGFWNYMGNIKNISSIDNIIFRSKKDYSDSSIQDDWWIWKVNQPFKHVGKLNKENSKAELGLIFHPEKIVERLRTGSYGNIYSKSLKLIKRVQSTKIGDIFSAPINSNHKKYIQYIISDFSQLNSDVIRAFKRVYDIDENPGLSEIVKDDIDFYAHCVTKAGIKDNYWEKIGNIQDVGCTSDIYFKCEGIYDRYANRRDGWRVWKINEDVISVQELEGKYKKAEFGGVFPCIDILVRLQISKYGGYLYKYF